MITNHWNVIWFLWKPVSNTVSYIRSGICWKNSSKSGMQTLLIIFKSFTPFNISVIFTPWWVPVICETKIEPYLLCIARSKHFFWFRKSRQKLDQKAPSNRGIQNTIFYQLIFLDSITWMRDFISRMRKNELFPFQMSATKLFMCWNEKHWYCFREKSFKACSWYLNEPTSVCLSLSAWWA